MARTYDSHSVRIIAGLYRGRKIQFAENPMLRPTGDRIRETLFNWLTPYLPGARCLDLFAGSGILGFEALSRGAQFVTLVEQHAETVRRIQANADKLSCKNLRIIQQDALSFLKQTPDQPYSIVFLDPPFAQGLLSLSIHALESQAWLTKEALIYIESELNLAELSLPDGWSIFKEQKAGQVLCRLVTRGTRL